MYNTMNGWAINLDKLPNYKTFSVAWTEQLDKALMQRILQLPDDHPHFNKRNTFAQQKQHLKKIIDLMNGNNLYVKSYRAKNLGRHYPVSDGDDKKNGISVICLGRPIKHTIMKHCGWIDIDMCVAHPSILYGIAKLNGRQSEFPVLANYINDKQSVINYIKSTYSLPENPLDDADVKDLLSAYAYGGGFERWANDDNIPEIKNIGENKLLCDFRNECRQGIDLVYINNPDIVNKIKGDSTDEWEIKKKTFSYWCGIIENDILYITYKYLLKEGIIGDKLGAKEFDGLCFKPLCAFDRDYVCKEISKLVLKAWGFEMKFKFKDYPEAYDFPEPLATPCEPICVDAEPIDDLDLCDNYNDCKRIFEKTHCKIVNKSLFIKTIYDNNGHIAEFIMLKKSELQIAYEHLSFTVNTKKGTSTVSFMDEWLKDPTIRRYDDFGMYPPPTRCPPRVLNLWIPFRAETLPKIVLDDQFDKDYIMDSAQKLLNHIKILCNHETNVYEYIVDWIAQALVYPAIKTTSPHFISAEGAGKGTFNAILEKLMGKKKIFVTTEPAKYVWGNFNELMKDAFIVNLNELDPRSMEMAEGVMKGLQTDDTIQINSKGKAAYSMPSYHRLFGTSNVMNSKSKEGDRRNSIIKCSNELKGNADYFSDIHEILDDDRVIYILYKFLINRPNLDSFHKKPAPLTSYQEDIQVANRDAVEVFLESFTFKNWNEDFVKIRSSDLYAEFVQWRDNEGYKYETSSARLIRNIKVMNFERGTFVTNKQDSSLHTEKGNYVKFDIAKLKRFLNLTVAPVPPSI